MKAKDITGQKFNRLTAIRFSHLEKKTHKWFFKCDCGKTRIASKISVMHSKIKACEDCAKEKKKNLIIERNKIEKLHHGHSILDKTSRTYNTWRHIKIRCMQKNHKDYERYGAKGIIVCDRWKNSFENFLEDMGERPRDMTLDRIDNSKGYNKENCRWATLKEQGRNKTNNNFISYKGETKCISEWASLLSISYGTLYSRLFKSKWSIKKSLETNIDITKRNKNVKNRN